MKTLSEIAAEAAEERKKHLHALADKLQAFKASLSDDTPLYVYPTDDGVIRFHTTPADVAKSREYLRGRLTSTQFTGIACDHCDTELVCTRPGQILTSHPPQINLGCAGCGWSGYGPA